MGWSPPRWRMFPRCLLLLELWLVVTFNVALVAQCVQDPGSSSGGYRVTFIQALRDGTGIVADLEIHGEGTLLYGPDIRELQMVARFEGDSTVHVHITDANSPRWEIPQSIIPRPSVQPLKAAASPSTPPANGWQEVAAPRGGDGSLHPLQLKYSVNPFGFSVTRQSNQEVLFDTLAGGKEGLKSLVFKDQYLEISTSVPESAFMYGLGESTRSDGLRLLPNKTFTMWATDIGSWFTDIPLYSTYPFLMDLRENAMAHGVLLLNSNGMDIRYEKNSITFKVIGGVLDFYIFSGPTPLSVIDQLTSTVGRPAAFPYWSLGFHSARYGYRNVEELQRVTRGYKSANLPMESISVDIDYMHDYKDFTLSPDTFPASKLLPYVDDLHSHHQKFIMIIDPNVKVEEGYKTYDRGVELDLFLRNSSDPEKSRYVAQLWPGASNIPDFLHPSALQWWTREIREFREEIPFDGLWLDMNEPANFCSGPNCYYEEGVETCSDVLWDCCMKCDNDESRLSRWENPPYAINSFGVKRPLYMRTVSMGALHHDGSKIYDTHNLYGTTEAVVTHQAMKNVTGTRPFLLSRSCFFGAGSVTAHWTGDNGAMWVELGNSVVDVMSSGFFGMPMVGSDICGYSGDTTEELCRRWIQVGAFYPFSRSHSDQSSTRQELYQWKSVRDAGAKVLYWRYRLLPFWYTLQYGAHTTGAPYVRPLFFAFLEDRQTWNIKHQFMIGEAILVSPVVTENTTSVRAYFPRGVWHDLFGVAQPIRDGGWLTPPTPMDAVNVHVRGGSVVPLQQFAMTTTEARQTPFTLLVAFERAPEAPATSSCNEDREDAVGYLFVDDDSHVEMKLAAGQSSFVRFEAKRIGSLYTLKSFVSEAAFAVKAGFVVDVLKVLGMTEAPQVVYVNGIVESGVTVKVNDGSPAVEISGFRHPLGKEMEIAWSTASDVHRNLLLC